MLGGFLPSKEVSCRFRPFASLGTNGKHWSENPTIVGPRFYGNSVNFGTISVGCENNEPIGGTMQLVKVDSVRSALADRDTTDIVTDDDIDLAEWIRLINDWTES